MLSSLSDETAQASAFSARTNTQYTVCSVTAPQQGAEQPDAYPVILRMDLRMDMSMDLRTDLSMDVGDADVKVEAPNPATECTKSTESIGSIGSDAGNIKSSPKSCEIVTPISTGKRRRRSLFFNSSETSFQTVDLSNRSSPHGSRQDDLEEGGYFDICCVICLLFRSHSDSSDNNNKGKGGLT
jgi:hypothetical protein